MKKLHDIAIALMMIFFVFVTCKQDPVDAPTQQPPPVNRPPVANAGRDTTLTLTSCYATAFVTLDGSGSSDPDNTSITYLWTVFLVPNNSGVRIPEMKSARTLVSEMTAGRYGFSLTVTDPGGLSAKDTIFVDVIGQRPTEYNLDITIISSFQFADNSMDCYYCYNPCCYYDYSYIDNAPVSSSPIATLHFYAYETADTANASNVHDTYFGFYSGNSGNGASAYGTSTVNLKRIFLNGGGSFSGTFSPDNGSALGCDPNIFKNLVPLTVTGTLNTTTNIIALNIKGKIYF